MADCSQWPTQRDRHEIIFGNYSLVFHSTATWSLCPEEEAGASRAGCVPEVLMAVLPIRRHEPQFALLMISANAAWLKDAARIRTHSERARAELITKQ